MSATKKKTTKKKKDDFKLMSLEEIEKLFEKKEEDFKKRLVSYQR